MLPTLKMAARGQLQFFLWAQKTIKLRSEIIHIPHDMEMCRSIFQGFTEIQNGRHGSTSIFLWAQKLKHRNYSHFTITFPTIWRCGSDFLRFC